jgi:hypothetical protein
MIEPSSDAVAGTVERGQQPVDWQRLEHVELRALESRRASNRSAFLTPSAAGIPRTAISTNVLRDRTVEQPFARGIAITM